MKDLGAVLFFIMIDYHPKIVVRVMPLLLNRTFLRKCPFFVSTPSQEPSFEFEIYQEVLYLHE